jgi:hypothetical protein
MLSFKLFLVLVLSCQLYLGEVFDGNLNQQVLSNWTNINSKYINVANRNISSVNANTFNGLVQLEQLYVCIIYLY